MKRSRTEHFKEHKQALQQVKGTRYLQGSDVVNFPKLLFSSETKISIHVQAGMLKSEQPFNQE